MRIDKTPVVLAIVAIAVLIGSGLAAQQDPVDERFDLARLAWDTGDFVRSLEEFKRILGRTRGSVHGR